MAEGAARRKQRVLVVGAGVNGAALAWLAAEAGHEVDLVAPGRPAASVASTHCALVAGLTAPGQGLFESFDATATSLVDASSREREGRLLLQQILLRARRPVFYRRLPLRQCCPPALPTSRLDELVRRLTQAGYPVVLDDRSGQSALVRHDAGILRPRRLIFELLRAATKAGATLRLRTKGLPPAARYDAVFWADHRAMARDGVELPPGLERRAVLGQSFAAGKKPLEQVILTSHGDLCLLPDPARSGRVRLVRVAEENAAGGLSFPRLPSSWEAYTGTVIRQTIADAHFCRPGAAVGGERCLSGLATAPVATVLGYAAAAVQGLSHPAADLMMDRPR